MAKSKRGGKSYTSGYANYKNTGRETKNRLARLTKLAAKNPNNLQLEAAIKNIAHRRNTPKTPYWKSSMVRIAKIIKEFTGKFDRNIFSTDIDLFSAATRSRNENKFKNVPVDKTKGSMFTIGKRIGWKS